MLASLTRPTLGEGGAACEPREQRGNERRRAPGDLVTSHMGPGPVGIRDTREIEPLKAFGFDTARRHEKTSLHENAETSASLESSRYT